MDYDDFQTMTREGVPVGDLEIEIGRLRGAVEATKERQDRDMAAMTAQMERERVAVNARFADIKKQLDGQDTKLDVLMRKQDEAVGAREEQTKWLGTWFKVLTVLIPLTAILLELFRWKLL